MKTQKERRHLKNQLTKQFALYDGLVNKASEVLQQYTCSSECSALCCKLNPICFEQKEYYKILEAVDAGNKALIEERTIKLQSVQIFDAKEYGKEIVQLIEDNGPFKTFLAPCPLLNGSDKCSIYQNRPSVCRRYPFEFARFDLFKDFSESVFMLKACDIGIEVAFDYGCWQILSNSGDVSTTLHIVLEFFKGWAKYRTLKEMPTCAMVIDEPNTALEGLLEYIISNQIKIRLARRCALLRFVGQHLDKSPSEDEIAELLADIKKLQ
ncbi:MAG TPA: YkgJ family cysteine cluster protein [Methanosarcina sp.]|nr:YkgJ family cysteine cluster protein [Methanosarcina sp.]